MPPYDFEIGASETQSIHQGERFSVRFEWDMDDNKNTCWKLMFHKVSIIPSKSSYTHIRATNFKILRSLKGKTIRPWFGKTTISVTCGVEKSQKRAKKGHLVVWSSLLIDNMATWTLFLFGETNIFLVDLFLLLLLLLLLLFWFPS